MRPSDLILEIGALADLVVLAVAGIEAGATLLFLKELEPMLEVKDLGVEDVVLALLLSQLEVLRLQLGNQDVFLVLFQFRSVLRGDDCVFLQGCS